MSITITFPVGYKPVLKHEEHDQSDHGNREGGDVGSSNLQNQAKQFKTFEEFSNAISQGGLRPKAWHIADKDFKLDPDRKPTDRTGSKTGEAGLFVGDPETWQDYATGRETVIEYDLTGLTWTKNPLSDTKADFFTDQSGNQGFFVRSQGFGKLKEVGRFTVEEAISRAAKQQSQMPKSKEEARKIWESLNKVLKHGEHDQSTHGSWATNNFDEETQGEEAQNNYFDKYGIKTDGSKKPVGISNREIRSLDDYTADGFKTINQYLRLGGSTSPYEENSYYDQEFRGINQNRVADLDKLIEESPDLFGDKNLYRVFANTVLEDLQKGDVLTDRAFLSTTRVDITDSKNADTLENLKLISTADNRTAIILPSASGNGKGLAVDYMKNAVSDLFTNTATANREKEVILPRNTPLKYMGLKEVSRENDVNMVIAVFQRMDK